MRKLPEKRERTAGARGLGIAKSTASRRMHLLLAAGLIERSAGGLRVTRRTLDTLLVRVSDASTVRV